MEKIVEYQVAVASADYKKLVNETNRLIQEGFEPFGSVAIAVDEDSVHLAQAMVKYGD